MCWANLDDEKLELLSYKVKYVSFWCPRTCRFTQRIEFSNEYQNMLGPILTDGLNRLEVAL